MTKTTTTSYKNSKESSKTEKSKNSVLIILCIFSIIAVFLLIIIYIRGSYKNKLDTHNEPPINDVNNTRTLGNPVYQETIYDNLHGVSNI
jgi:NADH:ubiquinone oxidoreductase subunit 6 (subunit J)